MIRYFRNAQVIAAIVTSNGHKPRWLRWIQRDRTYKVRAVLHKYSCLTYPILRWWTRKRRDCGARDNIETERIDRGIGALMFVGFISG